MRWLDGLTDSMDMSLGKMGKEILTQVQETQRVPNRIKFENACQWGEQGPRQHPDSGGGSHALPSVPPSHLSPLPCRKPLLRTYMTTHTHSNLSAHTHTCTYSDAHRHTHRYPHTLICTHTILIQICIHMHTFPHTHAHIFPWTGTCTHIHIYQQPAVFRL